MKAKFMKKEDMYRKIFDDTVEGIYLITPDGRYIIANSAMAKILGYESSDELMAELKDIHKVYVKPDRSSKFINLVKQIGTVKGFESEVCRKDGCRIWISESTRSVYDSNREIICLRGMIEDITMRKNFEMSAYEKETNLHLMIEEANKNNELLIDIIDEISESYNQLEGAFLNSVINIVNALEEKRTWTHGHSGRVANYSVKIAHEMGLAIDDVKNIRLAGLLHDIGVMIKNEQLTDKNILTEAEYDLLKAHPVQGAMMFEKVEPLKNVAMLIRSHHERMDGTGYPDSLKGDQIPIGAKILHAAESFDSMTTDRPYRSKPGREYALQEFEKNNYTQFDPDVAKAAMRVL